MKFDQSVSLTVNGTLDAQGTASHPITFDRSGASGTWGGIQFSSGSSGTLQYANIIYTTKGVKVSSTNNVTIDNCTIEHFSEQGIYANNSSLTVTNSIIRNDDGASHGIYLLGSGTPTITNNTIDGISIGIERKDSPGNATISDNTIKYCFSGIKTYQSSPDIHKNFITLNVYGVRLATGSSPDIHDNDIYDNSTGVYLEQSQPSRVKWNNFGWSGGSTGKIAGRHSEEAPANTAVPHGFTLEQNWPNPFNPSTVIRFRLPEVSVVTLTVYDLQGRKVRTLLSGAVFDAGVQQLAWNGRNDDGRVLASGVYVYKIQARAKGPGEHFSASRKLVLVK